MEENRVPPSIAIAIALAVLFFAYSSIARSAEREGGKQYAVFLNGGGDFELNSERFDRGLAAVYRVYRDKGVPSKDLFVLSGSGKAEDVRTGTTVVAGRALSAFDYDGDKKPDVDAAATKESLQKTFKELSKKMKAGDRLSIVITGPSEKQTLAGEMSLKLWGQNIEPKELRKLLDLLPAGTKKTIVTDVAFGGELTKMGDDSTVILSANDKTSAGVLESGFLKKYADVLSREGATPLAAYHRSLDPNLDSGRDSIAEYISAELMREVSDSKASAGEICASCVISRLTPPESDAAKKLRKSNRENAEKSSVEELSETVKKTRPQYFDGDLKYAADKEYDALLASVQAKKKELSEQVAQAKSSWDRQKSDASISRRLSEEGKWIPISEQIKKTAALEKALLSQREAVKNELMGILSLSPSALEVYGKMKKTAQEEIR